MNTDFLDYINWLAIIAAAIGYFMLGAVWYSKLLFVKPWMLSISSTVTSTPDKKGFGKSMLTSFIFIFISCFGIAVFRSKLDIHGALSGLKLGALTGICFAAVSISNTYVYERKPLMLYLINCGYLIAGNLIAAVVICWWS